MTILKEFENINLKGYECFWRENTGAGELFYLKRKEPNGMVSEIRSLLVNLQYQINHGLTDTNKYKKL